MKYTKLLVAHRDAVCQRICPNEYHISLSQPPRMLHSAKQKFKSIQNELQLFEKMLERIDEDLELDEKLGGEVVGRVENRVKRRRERVCSSEVGTKDSVC